MANALTTFDKLQLPARLQKADAAVVNTDLMSGGGAAFPVLSFKGKVWHLIENDERTLIAHPDTGDPLSSIEVILVKANKGKSKVYYASGYTEGSAEKPDCFSNDGEKPDATAKDPQASSCQTCPHNAWGSRITENGSKGKACSDSKRMAVSAPLDIPNAMLLRVPAASLKELTSYANKLMQRNVPYDEVVTKIGFDHTVAHPQLTFSFVRFLNDEESTAVKQAAQSERVGYIIGTTALPQGEAFEQPAPKAKPALQAAPAKAAKPMPVVTEEDIERVVEVAAPAKTKTKASAFAAPAAAPAKETPKAAPAAAAEVGPAVDVAELSGLLETLDD